LLQADEFVVVYSLAQTIHVYILSGPVKGFNLFVCFIAL